MINNILSIDFDYIMFPCIKLYNDMSHEGENSTVIWDHIQYGRGVDDKFLSYDPESYNKLVMLIKKIVEYNKEYNESDDLLDTAKELKKYCITDHEKIVDILKNDHMKFLSDMKPYSTEDMIKDFKENYKYNLVNIDFHHDVMYRPQDRNSIMSFDKYNCSNWVGYLMLKNMIESYTWIKAPNSDLYDHKLDGKYNIEFITESFRVLDDLSKFVKDHNFDYIFLCLSPQWVPYKYKHLYDLIVELFDFKKIDPKPRYKVVVDSDLTKE